MVAPPAAEPVRLTVAPNLLLELAAAPLFKFLLSLFDLNELVVVTAALSDDFHLGFIDATAELTSGFLVNDFASLLIADFIIGVVVVFVGCVDVKDRFAVVVVGAAAFTGCNEGGVLVRLKLVAFCWTVAVVLMVADGSTDLAAIGGLSGFVDTIDGLAAVTIGLLVAAATSLLLLKLLKLLPPLPKLLDGFCCTLSVLLTGATRATGALIAVGRK